MLQSEKNKNVVKNCTHQNYKINVKKSTRVNYFHIEQVE